MAVEPVTVAPWDSHNQALVANVHPADWVNPKPAPRYNLVVIGAGTAGLITASGAAGLGAKVALIEKHPGLSRDKPSPVRLSSGPKP